MFEESVKAVVSQNNIELAMPWEARHAREFVRNQLRGRRWDSQRKVWVVPLSAANIKSLIPELSPELRQEMEQRLQETATRHAASLQQSSATDAELDIPTLRGELLPFQRAGVRFALLHRGVLLADDQGLGKTVQSLSTVEHLSLYPAVVYCPAVVKLNWKAEIGKWLPHRKVAVLGVGKRAAGVPPAEADFIVLNYDIAAKHQNLLLDLGLRAVIADESHYLKNRKAGRTLAVSLVVEESKRLEKVLFMSGTPVLNRPNELAEQLRLLGILDAEFGGFRSFAFRYCAAYSDKFGLHADGASHLDELHRRLRETCMIRRLKRDVLAELPDKTIVRVPVTITNRPAYAKADNEFSEWLRDKLSADVDFLKSIEHLSPAAQRLAMTKRVKKTLRAEVLAKRGALRALSGLGKVADAVAWIREFHESSGDEKLLVFAHHTEVQQALLQEFPDSLHILASDSSEQRQAAVSEFQTDASRWLIILSTPAAQTGLTLHAASNELFVEYEDTIGAHAQAEDRAHRIGQKNAVTVYRLHVEGSIDDDMEAALACKQEVFEATLNGIPAKTG